MTKPVSDRGRIHRPNARPAGSRGRGGRTHALALVVVLGYGAGLGLAVPGPPAIGQVLRAPEAELEDVIEIALVGRDLFAYDLIGSGSPSTRLEIGEAVAWMRASGRVGVVVTDRRVLAVTNGSGIWHEERLRVHESRPDRALIGKRVALVVTDKRLLGFDSGSTTWLDIDIGPNERVREARVGAQTGLVLTDRTAYGLSPDAGGFFGTPMSVQERVESVRVGANMATISTSRRVLVFRAPSGTWSEDRRKIN